MHTDKVTWQCESLSDFASELLDVRLEEDWDLTVFVPESSLPQQSVRTVDAVISLLNALSGTRLHKLQIGHNNNEKIGVVLESRIHCEEI